MLKIIFSIITISLITATACHTQESAKKVSTISVSQWTGAIPAKLERVEKSESEWKKELSKMEYYVLREKGTERSFTGDLLKNKDEGLYVCRGCGLPLFESATKYKSGSGWPSFYQPIKGEFIKEATDYDIGYARTEVMCAQCDGHLGHVFPDGPEPTGLRYCINSVSLDFVATKAK